MKQFWQLLFFLMIVACAAIGGVLIGQNFLGKSSHVHHHAAGDMHALFHSDLNLNAQQEKELAVIEKDFSRKKALYEEQMKLANMELAGAIKDGGYSSPQVQQAVDKIHGAMGALQKLTLQHLADMQAILSEEQDQQLEEKVIEQLYRNAGQ
ncbi:MAG: periplasmic heavy metal sensor [Alphaproteobacteria bacterium]|nr:periplasmic heavy metal sensor [Alphaproteobacteria bacterium]